MNFQSKWITTKEFELLQPIDVFHKELAEVIVPESAIKNRHVHFRKKLDLYKYERVIMNISADDYYKLYINGQFVAQGPANAYANGYNYNRLDITPYVKSGTNIIAVHVYYSGEINRTYNSGDQRQGLIADVYVDDIYYCGTDSSWLYCNAEEYSGRVTCHHKTQYLENIDFSKKESDWKELNCCEDDYLPVVERSEYDYIFRDEPAECLEVYRVYPKEIIQYEDKRWFLDFGTELTGQFYLKAQGIKGQTIRIMCGEEVQEENPYLVRYRMRCNCKYDETCILSGQEDELEFYEYKAFRYVNVFSDCDLNPDTFCVIAQHHPFIEKCTLVSDVAWAEDIWKLCVNTLKWGVQEAYLDCPSREKGQYLGDFTVSGLAHLYVTGDAKMYRKTLFDFANTTQVCKGMLAVAPGSLMQEIADHSLQYPMQVFHYYQYTKDIETVRELYPIIDGIISYFSQFEREDGLLAYADEKWNLIDWPANLRDGYNLLGQEHGDSKPCHNVLNAHYIGAISYQQRIQDLLGMKITTKLDSLKSAFLNAFYDEKNKIFYDTLTRDHSALHSNVLPVFYQIAPRESWDTIKSLIMEKGLSCGTCFSYFVLKALGKMNAYKEELELLVNEGIHSWVNMLKEGATTCFEAWGKEQKNNTSLCHPWSCSPIIVLIEDILKANPAEFGKDGSKKTILKLEKM